MSIIIGIDHGYYAIKTAHCSFPAGLTSYGEHEPYTRQGLLELSLIHISYFQKKSKNLFALFLLSKSSVMRYFYFLAVLKELYCTKNILCSFQVHSSMLYLSLIHI